MPPRSAERVASVSRPSGLTISVRRTGRTRPSCSNSVVLMEKPAIAGCLRDFAQNRRDDFRRLRTAASEPDEGYRTAGVAPPSVLNEFARTASFPVGQESHGPHHACLFVAHRFLVVRSRRTPRVFVIQGRNEGGGGRRGYSSGKIAARAPDGGILDVLSPEERIDDPGRCRDSDLFEGETELFQPGGGRVLSRTACRPQGGDVETHGLFPPDCHGIHPHAQHGGLRGGEQRIGRIGVAPAAGQEVGQRNGISLPQCVEGNERVPYLPFPVGDFDRQKVHVMAAPGLEYECVLSRRHAPERNFEHGVAHASPGRFEPDTPFSFVFDERHDRSVDRTSRLAPFGPDDGRQSVECEERPGRFEPGFVTQGVGAYRYQVAARPEEPVDRYPEVGRKRFVSREDQYAARTDVDVSGIGDAFYLERGGQPPEKGAVVACDQHGRSMQSGGEKSRQGEKQKSLHGFSFCGTGGFRPDRVLRWGGRNRAGTAPGERIRGFRCWCRPARGNTFCGIGTV